MTIYNSGTFWNEALNLRTEKENLLKSRGEKKDRKSAECRITFHTVDYSASREDKGRPIVLKIQGRWGEIAFRVRVRCGMSTVGCWVNWIHVGNLNLQLKLKPALMFGASKGKSVFLVQIAARCSAARLGANTRKRSCGERPQLSRKSRSDSGGQLIKLTPFFFFPSFFLLSFTCLFTLHQWGPPLWDCIKKLTGSTIVLLQPWLTLYIFPPWNSVCIDWFGDKNSHALGSFTTAVQIIPDPPVQAVTY